MKFLSTLFALIISFHAIGQKSSETSPYPSQFANEFYNTWQRAAAYTLEVANAMPADKYDYRPHEDVLTFKEHLVHIIQGTYYQNASFIKNEKTPINRLKADDLTKEQTIEWLEKAFTYVGETMANISEEDTNAIVEGFWSPDPTPKKGIFLLMRDHMTHHRGMMVIYLRMNNITPPGFKGW